MIEKVTVFSPCRAFRYTLWREFDIDLLTGCADDNLNSHKFVQFIGLNPSTADEVQDDPTIRRCIGFAKAWGFGALCMTNLFGFRATDPKVMKLERDPRGHQTLENEKWIFNVARDAGMTVAAWGTDGKHMAQGEIVKSQLTCGGIAVHHLGLNQDSTPKHPLYLKSSTLPVKF